MRLAWSLAREEGSTGSALWDVLHSSFGIRVLLRRRLWDGKQQWFQGELGGARVAPGLCSMPGDSHSLEYTGLGSGAKTQF